MKKKSIIVEGLSKSYKLVKNKKYNYQRSLKEDLSNLYKSFFQKKYTRNEKFWALKDLSLEIEQGDVFGIIGGNGSGKSTLLKLISRITEPTEGNISIYGRIGALLEVGTGFHPDLTGRENIFLNGSILGMKREEIKKNFDAIVDFASVEKFLDTPVKRYSSGMFLRLAFSVIAFLRCDILLVDEVLAVGDASFQKKCIDKMNSVVKEGKTVVFVSHGLETLKSLCNKCLYLKEGRKVACGFAHDVVKLYISDSNKKILGEAEIFQAMKKKDLQFI